MGIRDECLEGGLFEAFRAPEDESVLATIERLHGAGSSILLRETDDEVSPVLVRRPGDVAAADDSRYQVLGEIARGGIGFVYKGRDKDLNRDIALKVLRPEYAQREDVVQRFVEEAQVAGQLQHPGIVPVYGIGLQEDGRPSFAMKLIKGQTLAELLDSNPRGIDLLTIFEQVAQTMAYAHSRGVIHRDLKPANVMVGAFGEVQVVDWGFAKVLGQEDVPRAPDRTVIATVRSGPIGSQSVAGSVMGTPGYMPPEQAMGRIADLDERSDVFALGAILCELLTGQPPYTGEPKDQLIAAAQSRLEPALERLAGAHAADEIKRLARDCLEPLPSDRPRNARIVAERLSQHLASAEERARRAELDAVTAETEATQARGDRRRAIVRAAVVLFVILAGGGGFLVWKSDRDAREAQAAPLIASALREAKKHEGEQAWGRAAAAAKRAADVAASSGLGDAGASALARRYERERDAAAAEEALRESDSRFRAELEETRAMNADHYGSKEIDAAYEAVLARRFPTTDVDTDRLAASPHALPIAAALDGWANIRRTYTSLKGRDWQRIDALARAIDPAHDELRDAMIAEDGAVLEALVETVDLEALPPGMINSLGRALIRASKSETAIVFLERALLLHPGEFWIHWRMGVAASTFGDAERAIRHFTAALSIRPRSVEARHWLGMMLERVGEYEAALATYREAIAQQPEWTHGMNHVRDALVVLGRVDEALAVLRERVESSPNKYAALTRLGRFHRDQLQQYDEALALLHRARELDPEEENAYTSLGVTLTRMRRYDEAIVMIEKGIERDPEYSWPHVYLAEARAGKGDLDGAEEALVRAVELDPDDWSPFRKFAQRLSFAKKWDAAIRIARKGLEFSPEDDAATRDDLGRMYFSKATSSSPVDQEALDRAIDWFRKAVGLAPSDSTYHTRLGNALSWKGDQAAAVASLREAVALDSANSRARNLLANALAAKGDWRKAVEQLREELGRRPRNAEARRILAYTLARNGAEDAGLDVYREWIVQNPRDLGARLTLANLLTVLGHMDQANSEWEAAIEVNSELRLSYAWTLQARLRRFDEAVEQYGKLIADLPGSVRGHGGLGTTLWYARRFDEAVRSFERAIELEPKFAEGHCNLALCLRDMGRWSEALERMRRGHELGTARGNWTYPSETWLRDTERMVALQPQFERAVEGGPVDAEGEARALLAEMLAARGHYALSAEHYQGAFREEPALLEIGKGHGYDAFQSAVQAGGDWHAWALEWARRWLETSRARLDTNAGGTVADLRYWSADPQLAPVRDDEEGLSSEWKSLWADADQLLEEAQEALLR